MFFPVFSHCSTCIFLSLYMFSQLHYMSSHSITYLSYCFTGLFPLLYMSFPLLYMYFSFLLHMSIPSGFPIALHVFPLCTCLSYCLTCLFPSLYMSSHCFTCFPIVFYVFSHCFTCLPHCSICLSFPLHVFYLCFSNLFFTLCFHVCSHCFTHLPIALHVFSIALAAYLAIVFHNFSHYFSCHFLFLYISFLFLYMSSPLLYLSSPLLYMSSTLLYMSSPLLYMSFPIALHMSIPIALHMSFPIALHVFPHCSICLFHLLCLSFTSVFSHCLTCHFLLLYMSLPISLHVLPMALHFISLHVFIPPANFVCGGYTVFTLSVRVCVRASVRPSVTLCFLNIFKSHCWIFIKPCKHVHICKTNTLNKKVRARGQFY